MKHTPTPPDTDALMVILLGNGYKKERAAFIVRSVNCHEELVKALKAVRVSLIGDEYYQEFKPLLKTVDEAITKAEIL